MAVPPMFVSHSTCSMAFERPDLAGQRLAKGGELLAERHRHGVLQLRPAHLQHVGELAPLARNASTSSVIAAIRRALPSAMPTCSDVG